MFLNITKQNLLSLVDPHNVYRYYIGDEDMTKTMLSPLRPNEKNPSFKLFIGHSGELCFHDFTLGLKGDFVKFVTEYYKSRGVYLNFGQTLCQIVVDLNLQSNYLDIGVPVLGKNTNVFIKSEEPLNFEELKHKEVKIKIRSWQNYDFKYWQQFGITSQILKSYNVVPVSLFYIDGEMYVADKYSYCYVERIDSELFYKIYQPLNKSFKWLGTFNEKIIQGYRQLPETGEFLIITKSLKDVMSLKSTANIDAIAFQSENTIPSEEIIENLKKRFTYIVILYDNDYDKSENHGVKFAKRMSEATGLEYVYFDEKYGVKDYSEAFQAYGENALEILNLTLL